MTTTPAKSGYGVGWRIGMKRHELIGIRVTPMRHTRSQNVLAKLASGTAAYVLLRARARLCSAGGKLAGVTAKAWFVQSATRPRVVSDSSCKPQKGR